MLSDMDKALLNGRPPEVGDVVVHIDNNGVKRAAIIVNAEPNNGEQDIVSVMSFHPLAADINYIVLPFSSEGHRNSWGFKLDGRRTR